MKTLVDAIIFASHAHRHQIRKNGDGAYINHPLRVMNILREHGIKDRATLMAAVLHDVLEDTETTEQELEQEFDYEVTSIVRELTKPKNVNGKKWQIETARTMTRFAKLIKLADRVDNLDTIPSGWSREKIDEYLAHTRLLLQELEGTHPELEEMVKIAHNLRI